MVNVNKVENQLVGRIVTNSDDFASVLLLRAICFMEDGLTKKQSIDGNDYQSTHFLMTHNEDPVGAVRIRWFKDFAKLERTCFREGYRHPRILMMTARFVFDHIAHKGYDKVITHAEPRYAKLWCKLMGFEVVEGKEPLVYPEVSETCIELIKHLTPHSEAISQETSALILSRIEGFWDEAHALEQ